jgi:hypothetical protein
MSMFLDSSRTLPDTKEGLGNPDMSRILLDSPTLLLSWPAPCGVLCGEIRGACARIEPYMSALTKTVYECAFRSVRAFVPRLFDRFKIIATCDVTGDAGHAGMSGGRVLPARIRCESS